MDELTDSVFTRLMLSRTRLGCLLVACVLFQVPDQAEEQSDAITCNQQSAVSSQWPVVSGQWSVVSSQYTNIDGGASAMDETRGLSVNH